MCAANMRAIRVLVQKKPCTPFGSGDPGGVSFFDGDNRQGRGVMLLLAVVTDGEPQRGCLADETSATSDVLQQRSSVGGMQQRYVQNGSWYIGQTTIPLS